MHPLPIVLRTAIILLCLSVFIFVLDQKQVMVGVRKPLTTIFLPIDKAASDIRTTLTKETALVPTSFTAAKQLQALQVQYNNVLAQNAALQQLQGENDSLRKALNAGLPQYHPLIGHVLFTNDRLVVQTETVAPVPIGAYVVQEKNVVGQITAQRGSQVYELTPTTNGAFVAKVSIAHGSDMVDGLAKGQYAAIIDVTNILANAQIANNDVVFIHDEDKPAVNGFILGKVTKIKKTEAAVFQEAIVTPLFDLTKDPIVYIMH